MSQLEPPRTLLLPPFINAGPGDRSPQVPHAPSPAEDEEEDEFEDATEIVVRGCEDLESAIGEAQEALNLFLNNRFDIVLDRLQPARDTSIYHSLSYSTVLFMQAMMTFDPTDITEAIAALKHTGDLCKRYRKPTSLTQNLLQRGTSVYTDYEMHAEVCFAESLLLRALLSFIEDESLSSFIRGALKVRTCYFSYKQCEKILEQNCWDSQSDKLHTNFEGGVHLGLGIFNLILSMLPARILKLLEFIGFSGDRELGLSLLRRTATHEPPTLRSPLASLVLLVYHAWVEFVLALPIVDNQLCSSLAAPLVTAYPNGALVLLIAGRLRVIQGQIRQAEDLLNHAISAQSQWRTFHHIAHWELMLCTAARGDFSGAYHHAHVLYEENRWSKTTYAYLCATLLLACPYRDTKEGKIQIQSLLDTVPQLKQRIAGKSIPIEKYCVVKARRFQKSSDLLFAHYELLSFWHWFEIIGNNDTYLQRICSEVDEVMQTRTEPEDRAVCLYIRALCLKHLQSPFQAQQALRELTSLEKFLSDNFYLVPSAFVELSLLMCYEQNFAEAATCLSAARGYQGYLMESRTHFKMHAVGELIRKEQMKKNGTVAVVNPPKSMNIINNANMIIGRIAKKTL